VPLRAHAAPGPWNITKRLEQKLGARLTVPGIIEVSPPRAEAALARKRESAEARAYEGTVILPDVGEYKGRVERGVAPEPR
jgi:hypothetical protein